MAFRGVVGQGCSHAPQPMQISSFTSGSISFSSYGTIFTAFVGQCSEQAPQSVFFVMTMQSSRTNFDFPICTSFFSSTPIGNIAPLGQTALQIVQSYVHEP